ncbi:hypothetical protein [Hymenobacter fastidiosus]|uniref:hypothetical protein n=1 Tax=Hymenobacter fastidiosus TaxID=486264 RepID=UPI0031EDBE0B
MKGKVVKNGCHPEQSEGPSPFHTWAAFFNAKALYRCVVKGFAHLDGLIADVTQATLATGVSRCLFLVSG